MNAGGFFFCKIYCFYRVGVKQSFHIIVSSLSFVIFTMWLKSFVMHLHVLEQILSRVSLQTLLAFDASWQYLIG